MGLDLLPWWGFALLSAVFAALTTILVKLGVEQVSSTLATAIRTVVVLVMAWLIAAGRGEVAELGRIGTRTWVVLGLSGVATGLSWLCYFRALQIGPTAYVAAIDKSSVILIALLAWVILREPTDWRGAVGLGMIAAGTLVLIR
ncbi:EamA family transporter [Oscillochloris sp. ZM17-4]|uniref:EamA family transporter n=1 Tax=Oscillochloris sp. ZM17-4 TaxID=2866714 RepID=UPI001C737F7A|nr:EamA family transporter [Oscillochloris sp. ZM17-4]MBX0327425.1 EamA family transporter [Oscillochloris sp. ZM17-4]